MKNSKKYILILCAVMLTALLCMGIVACAGNTVDSSEDIIYPTGWKAYIEDYVKLMTNTYRIAEDGVNVDINFEINTYDKKTKNFEIIKVVLRLNLSLKKYHNENALVFEVYKTNSNYDKKKVFSLYGDNESLYLQVYEDKYDKESKYVYSDAPLLDLLAQNVGKKVDSSDKEGEFIRQLALNTFTDCTVNSDKTEYKFKFNIASLLLSDSFEEFNKILNFMPGEVISAIYGIVGAENAQQFHDILMNTEGVLTIKREGDRVKQIEIGSIKNAGADVNGILNIITNKLAISDKPISGLKKAMPVQDGYERTKIATLTTFGKVKFKSSDNLKTLITYDIELNMSIDLLRLLLNNGDVTALSEDNYFHLSISHKCNANCNDYCSVELGNKFMSAVGSVLDIAFSPSDFGTHNIYIVTSLKSLIGENSLKTSNINSGMLKLILSDYQLLTVDSSIMRHDDIGGIIATSDSLLNDLLTMLNLHLWGAEINISDLAVLMNKVIADTDTAQAITDIIFTNAEVASIEIDCRLPQYGAIRTYDIAQRALFITSDSVDDGVVGVKLYDNALFASRNLPPISWQFDDGNYTDNNLFINNIYTEDGELIYGVKDGKELPVSPEEIKNLSGGTIKFSYTDIYGSTMTTSGKSNTGEARLLGISNINYNKCDEYQKVTLKLSAPTRISLAENRFDDSLINALDKMLYIYLDVNIKLTALKYNGIKIIRTDTDDDGNIITEYRIGNPSSTIKDKVLQANATLEYKSGQHKNYIVYGDDGIFDTFSTLLGGHMFNTLEECKITYNVAGKVLFDIINITPPNNISITYEGETEFRIYEKILLSTFLGAKVRITYDDNASYTPNFKISNNRYTIDNRSIDTGSDTWSVTTDGVSEYIIFHREGVHKVKVEYLGANYEFDIKIVSENTKNSTYKLTSKNSETYRIAGNSYNFYYDLDNKTFGSIGLNAQKITLELRKMNSSGYYSNVKEEEALIAEMKINGAIATNGCVIDLPPIIYKPIRIQYKITFLQSGNYSLRMYIPSYANEFLVRISDN